jgi:hypothetical protein
MIKLFFIIASLLTEPSCKLPNISSFLSERAPATAHNKIVDGYDDGYDQHDMDQTTGDMEDEAEQPQYEKYDDNRPENTNHGFHSFFTRNCCCLAEEVGRLPVRWSPICSVTLYTWFT